MKRPLLLLLLLTSTPPPAATTAVTRGSDRGNQPMRSGRRLQYAGLLPLRQQQRTQSSTPNPQPPEPEARHQIPPSGAVLDSGRAQTADCGQRTATIDRLLLPSFHSLWLNVFASSVSSAPSATDNHHHHWRQAFPEHYRNQKSRVN
ncbi:hypothetical protein ACLKA7_009519 [Drosophila subpalustris]